MNLPHVLLVDVREAKSVLCASRLDLDLPVFDDVVVFSRLYHVIRKYVFTGFVLPDDVVSSKESLYSIDLVKDLLSIYRDLCGRDPMDVFCIAHDFRLVRSKTVDILLDALISFYLEIYSMQMSIEELSHYRFRDFHDDYTIALAQSTHARDRNHGHYRDNKKPKQKIQDLFPGRRYLTRTHIRSYSSF